MLPVILTLHSCFFFRWFHGKISRKDAEKNLTSSGLLRGTFLIRESETAAGIFLSLTFKTGSIYGTYMIDYTDVIFS